MIQHQTHRDWGAAITSFFSSQNSWRVTVGSPSTACFVGACTSLASQPGSAPHPQKSYPRYLWLDIKRPAGPWFPMSGNTLQRRLEKQIAGAVTLLIRTRWHGPIHLCLLFDVLEWAEHRDGLFHWHLVWWIKHQCRLGIEFLNTKGRNAYGSRDILQSVTLSRKCFKDSQLWQVTSCLLLETLRSFCNGLWLYWRP